MAFEGLKSGMQHFLGDDGSAIAYADVAGAWVAVGLPLGDDPQALALQFEKAAHAAGKKAVFFGAEQKLPGWSALPIGQQPVFGPGDWNKALSAHKRLREQLRRARKKRVSVRVVAGLELDTLRPAIESLASVWLEAHHLEPLGFVVAVEPFCEPTQHRYLVAEVDSRLVGFLSAVPIPAADGWLVEDIFRAPDAPNGTTESLIDAMMGLEPEAMVTLGLAPLTGKLPYWLALARFAMRPLYDFDGLAAFKRRLHAPRWTPVWLVHRGLAISALVPVLRAFARGHLLRFAVRSLVRHPSGPPFVMALPLAPWTALLATLAATGHSSLLGLDTTRLWGWVVFDLVLMVVLYLAALRPRPRRLLLAVALASIDAVASVGQLVSTGFGYRAMEVLLRTLAVGAPLLGAVALWWAWSRARRQGANSVISTPPQPGVAS